MNILKKYENMSSLKISPPKIPGIIFKKDKPKLCYDWWATKKEGDARQFGNNELNYMKNSNCNDPRPSKDNITKMARSSRVKLQQIVLAARVLSVATIEKDHFSYSM